MVIVDQSRRVRRGHGWVDAPRPAASCACTADQLCLFHYSELDPGRQAQARRQAGIREPYSSRRQYA